MSYSERGRERVRERERKTKILMLSRGSTKKKEREVARFFFFFFPYLAHRTWQQEVSELEHGYSFFPIEHSTI